MKLRLQALEQRRGGAGDLVALVLFFADGEEADARLGRLQDDARVDLAHDGELRQHARRAIDIRADVDHHHGRALDDRRERRRPARAGRRPGTTPCTILAVAMTAPVLPADTNPWATPSRTSREATRMELSRLVRTALAALSSMVMRSLAWTISMGRSR